MKTDPGTQSWLRAHNDRAALRLLLDHGPLSRAQLGELSGMSKPTARQMVARLERIGLIAPVGQVTGQRGPNAVAYGVRADTITGVAISMLADSIQAVGVDPTGTEHEIVEIPTTGRHRSPAADVTAAVAAACTAAGLRPDSVSVVAIGVQAAVDEAADSLSLTDTLPGWPAQGARAELEAATGLTVILENDVNLATMAERVMGVAKEATEFAYLWVGHASAWASTWVEPSIAARLVAPVRSATWRCRVRRPIWTPTPTTSPICSAGRTCWPSSAANRTAWSEPCRC